MNASWTASSARSKSPVTRISVAIARPCSSRNRRSTASRAASVGAVVGSIATASVPRRRRGGRRFDARRGRVIPDRPDLDAAVARARDHRRVGDRLVEVGRLDEVEPAERLLGLGERPVGGDRPAVDDPDGRRRGGRNRAPRRRASRRDREGSGRRRRTRPSGPPSPRREPVRSVPACRSTGRIACLASVQEPPAATRTFTTNGRTPNRQVRG